MQDLIDLLLSPFGWVGMGLILLALEVMAPGTFMLWLGIAALITGGTTFALDLSLPMQLLCFAIYSTVSVIVGRRWFRFNPGIRVGSDVNAPHLRHVGQTVTVVEAIEGGAGRVKLGDSTWRAQGPDSPIGTRLVVAKVDGATLQVCEPGETPRHLPAS